MMQTVYKAKGYIEKQVTCFVVKVHLVMYMGSCMKVQGLFYPKLVCMIFYRTKAFIHCWKVWRSTVKDTKVQDSVILCYGQYWKCFLFRKPLLNTHWHRWLKVHWASSVMLLINSYSKQGMNKSLYVYNPFTAYRLYLPNSFQGH